MIAFASLAILAALLPNLAFAQQICPGTSVYTLESQFDILGNVSASNACACATLCNNEPRCSAYVFDESGILNIRNCYLKQVTPTANTVTYFKGSTVLGINGTFQDVSLSSSTIGETLMTSKLARRAAPIVLLADSFKSGRDGSGFTCFAADVATNAQRRIGVKGTPFVRRQGGGDNKGLVVGLAVTGSLVGALLLVAAAMYAVKMSRRKGLDHDAVYTLPWRKSGVFSASAGVGASSVVNGATGSMPRTAPTVGLKDIFANMFVVDADPVTLTELMEQLFTPQLSATSQEGFTIEQYLAAGWSHGAD
ncbi:hypothetical protein BC829DRAFT_422519 [Chytridium lagenaria]|nr:hypothetical protein BC829DRAFT_422519 [Chytridium lagenaria]